MRRNKRMNIMIILLLLVMCLTLGYAFLSTNLNINGTGLIDSSSWDIHFENVNVTNGSVTTVTQAPTINTSNNGISYSIKLSKPGDYYEFTVDVKNAGTLDGMIGTVTSTINGVSPSELPVYLLYSAKYNDGTEIQQNHLLKAGSKETYKIRIEYNTNIDPSDLPQTNQSYNILFNPVFIQSTDTAIDRNVKYYVDGNGIAGRIGQAIPNNVTIYDSYEEGLNYAEDEFFIRLRMENGIVAAADVGALLEGKPYYLKGGDTGASYQENKNTLLNMFGESNCTETSTYISCRVSRTYSSYGLTGFANTSGYVEFANTFNDGPLCQIDTNNSYYCAN